MITRPSKVNLYNEYTNEINQEATIGETTGRGMKECFAVGRRSLAEDGGEAAGVGIRVAEVEYGRNVAAFQTKY